MTVEELKAEIGDLKSFEVEDWNELAESSLSDPDEGVEMLPRYKVSMVLLVHALGTAFGTLQGLVVADAIEGKHENEVVQESLELVNELWEAHLKFLTGADKENGEMANQKPVFDYPDDHVPATEDWVKRIIPQKRVAGQDDCGYLCVRGTDIESIDWFYSQGVFQIRYLDNEGKQIPLGHGVRKTLALPFNRGELRKIILRLNADTVNGLGIELLR